jgi:hypothetical protein
MDTEKQSELKMWGIVLGIGLLLILLGVLFAPPLIQNIAATLEPGVGLKTASLWAFGVTFVMFLFFAVVAGDGLLGEIQYMLGSFFLFFVIITLLIAWAF